VYLIARASKSYPARPLALAGDLDRVGAGPVVLCTT